ncbi:DUF4438 domain-containing protein [Mesorhizobium huakuii]|uniref:DUF4438 domain-containing protein n=1 Tax=Mesorhizobium huakuii TaxID=28104 RepID=UPI00235C2B3E|nr:DUF4438 domain-containing protein [Mesorhizobium huakuii]GLQ76588.1 DUF4438 domain-containing protein [Mesorhizobium huakuii]
MKPPRILPVHGLRTNACDLVMISVAGQVASPTERGTPWRIGYDGRPRSLPGTGGIVLNHRVGDPCVGLAGDHVEPAVSIRNEARAAGGNPDAANQALQSYSCVGNHAIVTSGRAAGARGVVTGKHGGVDTVLIDFPLPAMRQMAIGDRIQVWAYGLGLRLTDYPDVAIWNCSPRLLARWRPVERNGRIHVKVTHRIPARVMGSGLGRNNVLRGDYDIQMSDPGMVRRYKLGSLRFGDIVGIMDADNRYGRSRLGGHVSVGVIVHSDSTVAGHGPGVVSLLSAPASILQLELSPDANIARYLDIRPPRPARPSFPLPTVEQRERTVARLRRRATASDASMVAGSG